MRVTLPNMGGSVFHINKNNKYPPEEGKGIDSLHTADVAFGGLSFTEATFFRAHFTFLKLDFKFSDLVKFCNNEL